MDEKKLKVLAAELAKGLKTEADLNAFSHMLTKFTVETALNAELTNHLGHCLSGRPEGLPGCDKQRYPRSHQEAQGVHDRRLGEKSDLSGNQGCVKNQPLPILTIVREQKRLILKGALNASTSNPNRPAANESRIPPSIRQIPDL